MIERVLTHHKIGRKRKIFYFTRIRYSDDILFACTNKFQKSMNKKDRRILNQYIATKQGKLLYQVNMTLLQIMDKEKKLIDNRFIPECKETEMNMYLTKRDDGKETII